jgi:hypothetical protein
MSDSTPPQGRETTPPASSTMSRRALWMLLAGGVVLVGVGIWLVFAVLPRFLTTPQQAAAPPGPAAAPEEVRQIKATLFYVSDDGLELVPTARDVRYGATPAEQAAAIVEAQIAPPVGAMVSAIPRGTTVRAVYLGAHGEVYVDLSAEASRNHTGGSQNEALAVYAIVNAVTANLPSVTGVQILIEGQEVDTLAGHVDLRQPFRRTLRWVRKAQSQP